jgi:hypothetical protein
MAIESEDMLPAIAGWLVQGGAQLYNLAPRRLSLEELFMRTISENL